MQDKNLTTYQQFIEWVHEVLDHLYDSLYLQSHPLAALLSDSTYNASDRSRNLRKVVLEAIDAICPSAGVPAQSPDWRAYRVLELRYVEGRPINEVMEQLGLGRSQYFREQARSLEAVTTFLWAQWQQKLSGASSAPEELTSETSPTSRGDLAHTEAERLCAEANWEEIEVTELLQSLRPIVESLAAVKGTMVRFGDIDHFTVPHADRVVLRQALLNVITYGLDVACGSMAEIGCIANKHQNGIYVHAQSEATGSEQRPVAYEALARSGVGLEVCQQLMAAMKGRLLVEKGDGYWKGCLIWPVSGESILLVIDDNERIVDLFQRYLAGYNWQVIGATSAYGARQVLAEVRPASILLDIMMPKEDGWELLRTLKGDPASRDIPVIICSVLKEPDLASMLGAVAYLPKPVSQSDLLQVLASHQR